MWRVAALYIVGAWVVLQVADLAFPGLSVPEQAIRYVWTAAIACFPLALFLGWRFDICRGRVVRTPGAGSEAALPMRRADYAVLGMVLAGAAVICVIAFARIMATVAPGITERPVAEAVPKSIAVLPFQNMSGDAANDAFTLGIHDDLLTHIAKISDLKVISRTSVARLDKTIGVREIGKLLGVATVLEGGVQRAGDRFRINAQLIDTRNDQHLWAETFDRELTTADIFDIQGEIATAIASKLQAALSPQDMTNLERRPTANLQAYEAYLLGKQRLISRRSEDLRQATTYFETAIALDPNYTLAHVGLAESYLLLESYGHLSRDEAFASASSALDIALAQDEQLGAVNAAKGLLHLRLFDRSRARNYLERAISQDPNLASPYHWLGDMLVVSDEPADAIAYLEKARELDPLAPVITTTLGEAYESVGRFDEAVALFDKAIETQSDYPGAFFRLGVHAHTVKGDIVEAVKWFRQELASDPQRAPTPLGMVYLDLGDDIEAERWIERGLRLQPEGFFTLSGKAFLHRFRGERNAALAVARRLNEINAGNNNSLVTLVRYAQYDEVVRDYAQHLPELDCEGTPKIHRRDRFRAMNFSLALEKTGRPECAARILEALLDVLPTIPRNGMNGYGFLDVEIYARQGQTRRALETLQHVIDEGRRAWFWAQILDSPHTISIRDHAEYKAIADLVRKDMEKKLATLRDLEHRGELAQLPDVGID